MSGLAFTGWGSAVPEHVVHNHDLARVLDTSDEWIRARSGIAERRWATSGDTTASLAAEAASAALASAGRTPTDLGLLILATCTPDQVVPATAATVCDTLGAECGCFDLNGACAGFLDAVVAAVGVVGTSARPVLVVGAERMTSLVDRSDRSTAVLFGDGAGAVVIEPGDGAVLAWDAGTDGSARALLEVPAGGRWLKMDGPEVFRRAVRLLGDSCRTVLDQAGLHASDVDLFVPHQANHRIIEAAATRLAIDEARTISNVDRWGNTSAASIPLAFAEAVAAGRLSTGDVVLTSGFGAGMTWATALLRWG